MVSDYPDKDIIVLTWNAKVTPIACYLLYYCKETYIQNTFAQHDLVSLRLGKENFSNLIKGLAAAMTMRCAARGTASSHTNTRSE